MGFFTSILFNPSRDFSPNLKQDLSRLSCFFFQTITLKILLQNERFELFLNILSKYIQTSIHTYIHILAFFPVVILLEHLKKVAHIVFGQDIEKNLARVENG